MGDDWETDDEYYRVSGCQCPEAFLCQGKCIDGYRKEAVRPGDSGRDTLPPVSRKTRRLVHLPSLRFLHRMGDNAPQDKGA